MANSRTISYGELRERLARLVKGPVLGVGDPAYEESRRVFNAMIERRPAAILRCSCAEDFARGVTAAREYDLPLSVKGGGHLVTYDDADVHVEIDDGLAPSPGASPIGTGSGITGMRERATALGGDLSAGFRRGGGFRVSARLPVRSSP